ncbi:MAG: metallophosphoesterase [Clostridiaceae bacterium]|nr:metallophosphoesterase [Clostridiaceae bacterium]
MIKNNVKMTTHVRNIRENFLTDKKVRNHLLGMIMIVIIYSLLHVYVGVRGWQAFGSFVNMPLYVTTVAFLGLLYPAAFITLDQGRESKPLPKAIAYLGYYWAAFFFYAVMAVLTIDFFRLINKVSMSKLEALLPDSFPSNLPAAGISVVFFVGFLLAIGTLMARFPRVRRYTVKLAKELKLDRPLKVVVLSDIHYGSLVSSADLNIMSKAVNDLEPDVVLLAGDIIDNSLDLIRKTPFSDQISKLQAKYGVFGVLGNHEYANADPDETIELFEQAGIRMLKDQTIRLADSFYLAGRNEKRSEFSGLLGQKSPNELLGELDHELPIIMMQHQPNDLPMLELAGADVSVAGHTHRGQMFPLNLLSRKKYEHSFGYQKIGRLQNIVSSGYGTWGPPIRLGSRSEIVLLEIEGR